MKTNKEPKIIVFDTESTDLNANIGFLLCASWKVLGSKKVHTIKIDDYDLFDKDCTDDYHVAKAIGEVLSEADGWVGWFSKYHDAKFVQTRLLEHRLPPIPPMAASAHIDCWRIAKYQLKLTSNRLATVSQFLKIKEKTPLDWRIWRRASAGYPDALRYVYKHCSADVECLEEAYWLLKTLDPVHFNVNLKAGRLDACPKCAAPRNKLQKRGWNYAKVSRAQRYQCMVCGAWSSGAAVRVKGVEAR